MVPKSAGMLYSGGERMPRTLTQIRRAIWLALEHDLFNIAKAAAYSGILAFFPALIAFTALLAQVPEGPSMIGDLRSSFDQFLPPGSLNLLQNSLGSRPLRSTSLILSASTLAVIAGIGVMLSLMEGFRRCYGFGRENWGFWQRWMRGLMLVPIVLVPLTLASLLLVFGHQIEGWMIANADHDLRSVVLLFWRLARWALAALTAVSVLAALYHFGTRRTEHWAWVIPGAVTAALVWFPSTLTFGWYVTRQAHYSRFYGPFAASIATLVWLYLTSFSTLVGAELNGVLYRRRQDPSQSPRSEIASAPQ